MNGHKEAWVPHPVPTPTSLPSAGLQRGGTDGEGRAGNATATRLCSSPLPHSLTDTAPRLFSSKKKQQMILCNVPTIPSRLPSSHRFTRQKGELRVRVVPRTGPQIPGAQPHRNAILQLRSTTKSRSPHLHQIKLAYLLFLIH